MLILSIETSCDETAISIVEAKGEFPHATYEIHGDARKMIGDVGPDAFFLGFHKVNNLIPVLTFI